MLSKFHSVLRIGHGFAKNCLQNSVRHATQSSAKTTERLATVGPATIGEKSEVVFNKEKTFGAENYAPIPVAICKGEGMEVFQIVYTRVRCHRMQHWRLLFSY